MRKYAINSIIIYIIYYIIQFHQLYSQFLKSMLVEDFINLRPGNSTVFKDNCVFALSKAGSIFLNETFGDSKTAEDILVHRTPFANAVFTVSADVSGYEKFDSFGEQAGIVVFPHLSGDVTSCWLKVVIESLDDRLFCVFAVRGFSSDKPEPALIAKVPIATDLGCLGVLLKKRGDEFIAYLNSEASGLIQVFRLEIPENSPFKSSQELYGGIMAHGGDKGHEVVLSNFKIVTGRDSTV